MSYSPLEFRTVLQYDTFQSLLALLADPDPDPRIPRIRAERVVAFQDIEFRFFFRSLSS